MDQLYNVVCKINGMLSDYVLVILLIGCGLWFSIKTKFVQVRCFGEAWKAVFGNIKLNGEKNKSGLSSFQALTAAVAAQVGTGNIIGASGAILTGGPGAIFWMWLIAFLGMATIYSEAVLAQETRVIDKDGNVHGGPVYYINKAFPNRFGKFLAAFFAVALILALGFTGCMVQSNSIGSAFNNATGVPTWVVGVIVTAIAAVIFLGGVQRLASVTEKLVPLMAVLYIIGGLILLAINIRNLPSALGMIFKYAFEPQAIIGGGFGAALKIAVSQGAKRGLFSNEAGMGSTPHAHAQANVAKPHDQGVVAMMGLFIDTFVVLTMTALVVITCLYAGDSPLITLAGAGDLNKTNMVQTAFSMAFGKGFGGLFVAICLAFFAFSTVLSWNFFGRINTAYLFHGKKAPTVIYTVISLAFIFVGSLVSNDLVWELSDMFNQIMVLPNVIGLVALTGMVAAAAKSEKK